jgi:hypothetical protein
MENRVAIVTRTLIRAAIVVNAQAQSNFGASIVKPLSP